MALKMLWAMQIYAGGGMVLPIIHGVQDNEQDFLI